jgi:hypothetical protein
MTLLFLVALAGFLAILAYGTVTLGAIHGFFGRLARKQDYGRR